MSAPQGWRLNPLVELHWRRWDDDWIVFEAASGKTHQMNSLVAFVAMCLEEGESNADALVEQASSHFDSADTAQVRAAVSAALSQFEGLGLVVASAG